MAQFRKQQINLENEKIFFFSCIEKCILVAIYVMENEIIKLYDSIVCVPLSIMTQSSRYDDDIVKIDRL